MRCAIVVGSQGGIGRAVVEQLTADGFTVVGWDLEPGDPGVGYEQLTVDVTEPEEVAAAAHASLARLGSLDGVVIASGTIGRGWLHETSIDEWQRVINTNLTAAFLVLRSTLPLMFDRGGRVVTIGSTASSIITGGGSAASYAASKAGLVQLTRQVAVDYAPRRILANCVCPGWIDTHLNERSRAAAGQAWTDERLPRSDFPAPLGGPGAPDQIAGLVRFLLGPEASYITGTAIPVDGGYTAI